MLTEKTRIYLTKALSIKKRFFFLRAAFFINELFESLRSVFRRRTFLFPLKNFLANCRVGYHPPEKPRYFTVGNGLDRSEILPPLKGDSPVRGDVERSETEGSAVCGEQRWILPAGQKTKGFYIFKPLSLLCRQLPC